MQQAAETIGETVLAITAEMAAHSERVRTARETIQKAMRDEKAAGEAYREARNRLRELENELVADPA